MQQLLLLAGIFFGVVLVVMAAYAFINRRELAAAEQARQRLRTGVDATGRVSILRDDRSSEIPFLNQLLSGRAFTYRIATELERAGSKRKVGEFALGSTACATIGLALGQLLSAPLAIIGGGIGLLLPWLVVKRMQTKRLAAFEAQLPDALDMLVNALRAGYSLQAGMDFVGKEVAAPLGPEFTRFYDEQRLGVEVRDALLNMQERIGTTDIKMFVTSLLIQRETGGNLGEILTNLANLMRERVAFRGHLATLTAEPKMSARILAALPFAALGIIYVLNRDFVMPLFTSEEGTYFLGYAVVSVAIGYVIMMRIADVEM
ncbi:MAG TPA: type II secretion system F family protein [Gemmatimonadaceae bacterium]|nr:type II secretion system F family protein [Gemmatimonadaceae bacterium]